MPQPIIIAHHLIWTAYGWWLPNDPRGSMSRFVHTDIIMELGDLHYGRKKVQPASRDIREFHEASRTKLQHQLLEMKDAEVRVLAESFREAIHLHKYTCYACVFMPDHVHALIRKHKHQAEDMIETLQDASRDALHRAGLRREDHPVWGGPGWKVFLDHPDEVRRTIKYVEDNPLPWRRPRQKWDFVKPYDGWPLHPGHSPSSPYARRLRGHE